MARSGDPWGLWYGKFSPFLYLHSDLTELASECTTGQIACPFFPNIFKPNANLRCISINPESMLLIAVEKSLCGDHVFESRTEDLPTQEC